MIDDPEFLGSADELPDDARAVIDAAERAVAEVRDRTGRLAAAVRDDAERACAAVRERAEAAVAEAELEASRELAPVLRTLFDALKGMQEAHARAGRLDEALAVRARLRQLRADLLGLRPDPGTLTEFGPAEVGRAVLFEVTGRPDGVVWGTDVYTTDSRLAAAAVHAGAVRVGERAFVRVTLLDGADHTFHGSSRNGIDTHDYAAFPIAFRVERL